MGHILEELRDLVDLIDDDDKEELEHYGMPRRSGRYPWGSGKDPYQHSGDWLGRVQEMESKEGKTEKEIADTFQLTTTDLRAMVSIAKRERKLEEGKRIKNLQEKGIPNAQIATLLGLPNESSVRSKRSWYDRQFKPDIKTAETTADYLKKAIDEVNGAIDVGEGIERKLGISREKLNQALVILQNEGYSVQTEQVDRVTDPSGNHKITMMVVGKGDLPKQFIKNNPGEIHSIRELNQELTENGTKIRPSFVYPESMDSKRLQIVYGDQGGSDRDGLVEIRPGVKDLSLGDQTYSQVRILVDGDKYIKGMAVYNPNLPEGVDVRFNSNKPTGTPLNKVLKPVQEDPEHPGQPDPDNPFGALIKEKGGQTYYDDPNGKYVDPVTGNRQSLSLINKRAEEGDWGDWSDKVPSQMLSKQPKSVINRQLKFSIDERNEEFKEIMSVTNPTVKKDLLMKFAASCDTNAETLKAAAFPGQKYQVIIPIKSLKDNEVYAPNYTEGDQVALIRYPHGGTFEIPILTVNNKNREGRMYLGTHPTDAVGINAKVAERLSGADFDGDTVQVIPLSDKVNIKNSDPLPGLVGFNPKDQYAEHEGMRYMKYEKIDPKTGKKTIVDNTQNEMGKISNLITDMTLQGATRSELERAVKHSMVVIDAAKHKLDYKQSEIDNDIKALKRKYQGVTDPETGRTNTPAATIISRASAEASAPKTIGAGWIDKDTGKMVYKIDRSPKYKKVGDQYVIKTDKEGNPVQRMVKSTQMRNVDDAFELVHNPNNDVEVAYANYANALKSMANNARLETLKIIETKKSPSAVRTYAKEVESLKAKVEKAVDNQDMERWANIIATQRVRAKISADPSLEDNTKLIKKIRQQAITRAREDIGAQRPDLDITPREWEAIQAGAIGHTTLTRLLKYVDPDKVKKLAIPHDDNGLNASQLNMIKRMAASGYTQKQIAEKYSVSSSVINDVLRGKRGE